MPRIFDFNDYWDMAEAADGFREPLYTVGRLTNILVCITTLDDPYYMALTPSTYKATLREEVSA